MQPSFGSPYNFRTKKKINKITITNLISQAQKYPQGDRILLPYTTEQHKTRAIKIVETE